MSESKEGLVPNENVFGGDVVADRRWGLAEWIEDHMGDVIGAIEAMVGSAEIGLPRAYTEEIKDGRCFRDVYKCYPYIILEHSNLKLLQECFATMVSDVRAEVDRMVALGFPKEHLILQWRMTEKIKLGEEHCHRCGGVLKVRTRLLIKPDRDFYFGPGFDNDPGLIGPAPTSET